MNSIWIACLDLALEGLCAGSLAIAAVITDADGNIISKGRNQLFDQDGSCNAICNTIVSHAEMNALANLPAEYRQSKDLALYTTVEPCPMCMGAIAMSRIRNVVIASRDPYAGGTCLVQANHFFAAKTFHFSFETGDVEQLFTALHLISIFLNNPRIKPEHPFLQDIQSLYPTILVKARELSANPVFIKSIRENNRDEIGELIRRSLSFISEQVK